MQNNRTKTVLTIRQLAQRIGAKLIETGSVRVRAPFCRESQNGNLPKRKKGRLGSPRSKIMGVNAIEAAGRTEVTFLTDDRHKSKLEQSEAAAVIVAKEVQGLGKPQLLVDNVEAGLIAALNVFAPRLHLRCGIHPTAIVERGAEIAQSVSVGPGVVIAKGVQICENSVIGAGCKIGENSRIGRNSRLCENVVIYHNCIIGNNVSVQANTTIGSVGFGYYLLEGQHKLIPHNGGVLIEDFVEIGANCCIDRAKFGNTIIGAGTKIDNLVQIAHNVVIGKCCLIAGQAGLAGSAKLGDGVVLAGQAGVGDHVKVGDGAAVAAQSGVLQDKAAGQQVFGTPAIELKEALRIAGLTRRLPKFAEQLRRLAKRVEELEAAKNDKK